MLIWPENISFAKFKYKYPKNAEFCADFKAVEKNAKIKKVIKLQAKKCKNLEFALFFITKILKNFFNKHFKEY